MTIKDKKERKRVEFVDAIVIPPLRQAQGSGFQKNPALRNRLKMRHRASSPTPVRNVDFHSRKVRRLLFPKELERV
jgi:hypothetical protein